MKVLVDFQIFFLQRYGGISRYHATINDYINASKKESKSSIINLGCNNAYTSSQFELLKIFNRKGCRRLLYAINKYVVALKINKFDIFHPTYYDSYFLKLNSSTPYVITIHDMIPEIFFKESMKTLIDNKRKIILNASAIIAISETTKSEILNLYNIDPDTIHVIYHGYPEAFTMHNVSENNNNLITDGSYILFIGQRETYKNFIFFINAASNFLKKNNIQLKVIGGPASSQELKLIESLNLTNRVIFKNHVSDFELYSFYANALCFVFPSLSEGFGMPLLEAFIANCPVVCSDIPIFREICGPAAEYFKLDNKENLEKSLENILNNKLLRKDLIKRGKEQVKKFQWSDAATKTLNVYQSALKNNKTYENNI
ncbi:glycosyltransferase family 4 protein [Adhaeribacter swui]|uniref:Glycosyltransferase family 4 protein n=1 Tax=Adhaeribacter swui TaxID=2086471 RepID=A0A7G7G598_9BACT|nr:glycosyltransferase family 1 protein [Adhaeribacter swui]QNF32332.1 glycosyltransferase family 4 protein [Adhaeribacter swui]